MEHKSILVKSIIQTTNFRNESDVLEIMRSMKENGLLHPIGVRQKGKSFEVVYGNRRFEAAKKLGWKEIDCVFVESMKSEDLILLNITENIQRQDVSMGAIGRALIKLHEEMNMSYPEIAIRIAKPVNFVRIAIDANRELPEEYRDKVVYVRQGTNTPLGKISTTMASRAIDLKRSGVSNDDVKTLLDKAVKENMSHQSFSVLSRLVIKGAPIKEVVSRSHDFKGVTLSFVAKKDALIKFRKNYDVDVAAYIRSLAMNDPKLKNVLVHSVKQTIRVRKANELTSDI